MTTPQLLISHKKQLALPAPKPQRRGLDSELRSKPNSYTIDETVRYFMEMVRQSSGIPSRYFGSNVQSSVVRGVVVDHLSLINKTKQV